MCGFVIIQRQLAVVNISNTFVISNIIRRTSTSSVVVVLLYLLLLKPPLLLPRNLPRQLLQLQSVRFNPSFGRFLHPTKSDETNWTKLSTGVHSIIVFLHSHFGVVFHCTCACVCQNRKKTNFKKGCRTLNKFREALNRKLWVPIAVLKRKESSGG